MQIKTLRLPRVLISQQRNVQVREGVRMRTRRRVRAGPHVRGVRLACIDKSSVQHLKYRKLALAGKQNVQHIKYEGM
eukprot:6165204-Pleurochrysis_carterae.AAC.2